MRAGGLVILVIALALFLWAAIIYSGADII